MSAFNSDMPIETAQYLLAKCEVGLLSFRVVGEKSDYDDDCDAVVSSRGYDLDVANNPSDLAKSMRALQGFTINEEIWANNAEELEQKNKDEAVRLGEKYSAKMFKRFDPKADGKFYYSTGDYFRGALPERRDVAKFPARELVDAESRLILLGLIIPFSSGLGGAMANGRKVFVEKFAPRQVRAVASSSVVVTGVGQLQSAEVRSESSSRC